MLTVGSDEAVVRTPKSSTGLRRAHDRWSAGGSCRHASNDPLPARLAWATWPTERRAWEKCRPNTTRSGCRLAVFHIPDVVIVFDHLAQTATLATLT
jgi:hypothetical protein